MKDEGGNEGVEKEMGGFKRCLGSGDCRDEVRIWPLDRWGYVMVR